MLTSSTRRRIFDVDDDNIEMRGGASMKRVLTRLTATIATLWQTDRPLTAVGLIMIPALAASLVGIWLDPRMITGAPAWLKPAKFAASIGIYTLTLAWVFTYLSEWRRTRRIVGWTTAVVLILEL